MRRLQATEKEKTHPSVWREMRTKLSMEAAMVLNLKREVEKQKDKVDCLEHYGEPLAAGG